MSSRCFVTGANGFVGSQVVRSLLARGHRVIAGVGADLDTSNLEGLEVELRELDLLDEANVRAALGGSETLIHTAACYSFWEPDSDLIYRVNVEGTRNVLRAARDLGTRKVVHTSSTATLLPSLERPGGTEESLFDLRGGFQGHYKSSKLLAEMLALRFAARGLPLVIVHPTVVVGEGDRRPTPTGGIILHFINGTMKAYTDTYLNIVDVEDVALGHVLALEQGGAGEQYILGGENLRMVEVVSILSELTGIPAPRFAIPHRILLWVAHVNEWIADHLTHRRPLVEIESALHARTSVPTSSAKAEKELGYRPSSARPTLAKAARWFIDHGYCSPRYARIIAERGQL